MSDELTPAEVQEIKDLQREMGRSDDRDSYWRDQGKRDRYAELLGRQQGSEERTAPPADFSRSTMESIWKLPAEERQAAIERMAKEHAEGVNDNHPENDDQKLAKLLMVEPSSIPNIDRNWKAISVEIDGRDRDWIQAEFDGLSEGLKTEVCRALAEPHRYAEIEAALTPRMKSELRVFYDSITVDALQAIGRMFGQ